MSESHGEKRKVQVKLDRKFGASDEHLPEMPTRSREEEEAPVAPKPKIPYGGWGDSRPEGMPPAKIPAPTPRNLSKSPERGGPWGSRDASTHRDRTDHRPGVKTQFNSILASQKEALANPETAAAMQAELDPPWMKRILALTTDKGREKEGKFIADGMRCVTEMVEYHADIIDGIYAIEGYENKPLLDKITEKDLRLHTVTEEQMERISTTVTSQGIVAICRSASTKPDYDLGRPVTLVDGIQDPGNLGALFRTSLGFGMGMLLGKGSVNPFNPKVVRGSSGTFLRVPFEQDVDMLERIQFLRHKGYTIIATDLHAKQSLDEISPRKLRKVAILVGNEGAGADIRNIQHADEVVRIPMEQTLESLNVSVAHGILCFQIEQIRAAAK